MSKEKYDLSDIDDILAEYYRDYAPPAPEKPVYKQSPGDTAAREEYSFSLVDGPEEDLLFPVPPVVEKAAEDGAQTAPSAEDFEPAIQEEPDEEPFVPPLMSGASSFPAEEAPAASAAEKEASPTAPGKKGKVGKRAKKQKPEAADTPREEKAPRAYVKRRIPGFVRFLLSLVFMVFSLGVVCLTAFYLHPASGTVVSSAADTRLRLSDRLDLYVNNAVSDALGELTCIKKMYTLQESVTVAPAPDPAGFGQTYDPGEIQAVIDRAAILLDGQKMTFDPTADFVPDEPIRWYLDDTILVIAWKEYIEQRCCTFAEVKIAHGSQLRRKLAEDSYSSSVQLYASDMANASNAVVAMNGDFYAFRDLGITAYQRKLYRNNPAQVDSCFFTADGDMLFSRAGELMGEGEAQRFIDEHDVVFAVAFGPVLVDNGELQYCSGYPIGEINTEYSRSCIAMTNELHYLLMTINHTPDARPRATVNELARIIYSKNVWKAYTLDGGQTAEIIMMGGPINHVDFGYERAVSDIIYFATAIPEEVRS